MANKFKIFTGGPQTRFNACVGENGYPDIIDYYEGYFLSVNYLIEKVINDWPGFPVDSAIYPILFNLRHGIELALKKNLQEILKIKNFRTKLTVEVSDLKKHELLPSWVTTKESALLLDDRYNAIIQGIDPLIKEIADV